MRIENARSFPLYLRGVTCMINGSFLFQIVASWVFQAFLKDSP
jgi:hypothetical protein